MQRLSIARELKDKVGEGSAYCNIGNAYQDFGKFEEAVNNHRKHQSIAKEIGDKIEEGMSYCNLGVAYKSLGDFQKAKECHEQDLQIAKEVGNAASEGRAYCNLGCVSRILGNFQEAIQYHRKHLFIAKEMGNEAGEKEAYGNLGNTFQSLGNFQEAIKYHKKRLSIAKKLGDKLGEGRGYMNLGNTYISLGKLEKAKENYEKRQTIAIEVSDKAGEGRALGSLGNVEQELGDFNKALNYHNQHLAIAKATCDKYSEGRSYCNLGETYKGLQNFEEAFSCHKKALSIARETGDRELEGMTYANIGEIHQSLREFKEASESYQSSVNLLNILRTNVQAEDVWKITFRELYRKCYQSLWRMLLKLEKIEEALYAAEEGRAQALVDDLKIHYGLTGPPVEESKETISDLLKECATQMVFIGLERNKINFWVLGKGGSVELRTKEIEGGREGTDFVTELVETTLNNIGAGVGVRCENRSLDALDDDSSPYRNGDKPQAESLDCTEGSLQPLYDAIIDPIADLCHGNELIIVPEGPLGLAPLPAVSESIRIRTIPSLTSLKLIITSPDDCHSKSGALLVGNPCLEMVTKCGKPVFKNLENAEKEVKTIGGILKVQPLTGKEATKQAVLDRITSVALVHIAAHGKKETGEIALAPNAGWEEGQEPRSKKKAPKEEDYILKVSDVQAVRLHARLVVLSCCHSGRGEVMSEGVVGIARAFLAAGARSVLVSLWAINDEATTEFMTSFYQYLADGKSASVALHQAMKSLRDSEKFSAIKFWAPFMLIGDDVTLDIGKE